MIIARILVGGLLAVPSDTEVVRRVVGDLLDGYIRSRRHREFVAHPDQTLRLKALVLEIASKQLGGVSEVKVQAPVSEPRERLVRKCHEGLSGHTRILFDPDEVEVVVARVAGGTHHGAVRPRLEHVADRGMASVVPGSRAGWRVVGPAPGRHADRLWHDVATANQGFLFFGEGTDVLLGNGSGGFFVDNQFEGDGGADSVAVGDFNGDGDTDLVLAN